VKLIPALYSLPVNSKLPFAQCHVTTSSFYSVYLFISFLFLKKMNPREEFLINELAKVSDLVEELRFKLQLLESTQLSTPRHTPVLEPKVADPDFFNGKKGQVKFFLSQVNLVLQAQPTRYPSGHQQVIFAASFLRGDAFMWYQQLAEDPASKSILNNFSQFSDHLIEAFGEADLVSVSERQIAKLRQTSSVNAYYCEFKRLATFLKWNDAAQRTIFYSGLKSSIKDEMAKSKRPDTMVELAEMAIRLDNRLYERFQEKRSEPHEFGRFHVNQSKHDSAVVPMEIDGTFVSSGSSRPRGRLTFEEKQQRIAKKLCLYCASNSHSVDNCPEANAKRNKVYPKGRAQSSKKGSV